MKLQIADYRLEIETDSRRRAATLRTPHSALRNSPAFSLIEILVVVALLSFIILGLLAMFGQTQRAFRSGMTQVDVLEGGRVITDMIARELEQIVPTYQPRSYPAMNFFVEIPFKKNVYDAAFMQPLPGTANQRMNVISDLFFITRRNQDWIGIGYFVRKTNAAAGTLDYAPYGTGELFRIESHAGALSGRTVADLSRDFDRARSTTLLANQRYPASRIMEGVIHFQIRAYDTNGIWITNDLPNNTSLKLKSDIRGSTVAPGEVGLYELFSNAVPAAVELNIGLLEDRVWQRYKALPDTGSQYRYLTNQAGRVHLFRQRVAVHNFDPLAYQ